MKEREVNSFGERGRRNDTEKKREREREIKIGRGIVLVLCGEYLFRLGMKKRGKREGERKREGGREKERDRSGSNRRWNGNIFCPKERKKMKLFLCSVSRA